MIHPMIFVAEQLRLRAGELRCHLDLPKPHTALAETPGELTLGGWSFGLIETQDHPKILASVDEGPLTPCEPYFRPDVNQKFRDTFARHLDDDTHLGFLLKVKVNHLIRLFASYQGEYVLVFVVVVSDEGQSIHHAIQIEDFLAQAPGHHPLPRPTEDEGMASNINKAAARIQMVNGEDLPTTSSYWAYRDYLRSHQNLRDLVQSGNLPMLRHPVSGTLAKAVAGGYSHGHVFWVRFADANSSFYVIQIVSSVDAIYIPAQRLLIKYQHTEALNAHAVLTSLLKHFDPRPFLGFYVGHTRPAHLVQDVLPALGFLAEANALPPTLPLCCIPGSNFVDAAKLYGLGQHTKLLSVGQLAAGFVCMLGAPQRTLPPGQLSAEFYARQFARLQTLSRQEECDWPPRKLLMPGQHYVLWLGIAAQKRVWVNQVEGLSRLIEVFQKRCANLIVVFDGWTCPCNPSQADLAEVQKDRDVMHQVLQTLPVKPACVDLIGQTISKKIAMA
ncbi:MAG TPA: hypothetical protein VFV39_01960, partial [Limnobacter sp.]|nr:hypothetical protein [Limnobacter sp.]